MDPNAMPGLFTALDHPDPNVRIVAAEALGKIGSPLAIDPLLAVLNDDDWAVRWRVVWALGQFRHIRALPGLRAMLDDPEKVVRDEAEKSLQRLGTPDALAALDAWRAANQAGA